jgi:hypothetical protein
MAAKPPLRRTRVKKATKPRLSNLLAENAQLQKELKETRAENRQLKRSIGALMSEDIPINKKLMLSEAAKEPRLEDLITELENGEA